MPITGRNGVRTAFRSACTKAGITYGRKAADGAIFHDIRRTVKTKMAAAGVDKVYRNAILGHSQEGMDAHYMAPSEDDLHQAMDKFTALLDREIANVNKSVNNDQAEQSV